MKWGEIMITGASSGISVHLSGSGQFRGTKEDGLIFDSLLSGMIKGKGPAPGTQEEAPDTSEMMTSEQNTDQETTEQAYMSLATRGKWVIPSSCGTTKMFDGCGVSSVTLV